MIVIIVDWVGCSERRSGGGRIGKNGGAVASDKSRVVGGIGGSGIGGVGRISASSRCRSGGYCYGTVSGAIDRVVVVSMGGVDWSSFLRV